MNPPASVSRADNLRQAVVRLECPHELSDGSWDGPIYVRLREPRHITPDTACDFIVDDSSRRPGWMCELNFYPSEFDTCPPRPAGLNRLAETDVLIPYTRLIRPDENLRDEIDERPLLMLYRFVRFHTCYVAEEDNGPRHYVEVQLGAYALGQIVLYRTTRDLSFRTATGAVLQPSSRFVCFVEIRHRAADSPVYVLLPCDAAWQARVDRDEFMVGWCHGVPINSRPNQRARRFRSRWKEVAVPDIPDAELQKLLKDTFVPAGSDTTVDSGSEPIAVATEFGRAITLTPLQYAKQFLGPPKPSTRMDMDVDSDEESSSTILAMELSKGRPLPRSFQIVQLSNFQATPLAQTRPEPSDVSTAAMPTHPAEPAVAEAVTPAALDVPVPTAQPATDAVLTAILELTKTTQQMLTAQAASQQLLQEQLLRLRSSAEPSQRLPHSVPQGPPQLQVHTDSVHRHHRRRSRSRSPVSSRLSRERRSRSRSRSRSRDRRTPPGRPQRANHSHPPRHGRPPAHGFHSNGDPSYTRPSGYDDGRSRAPPRDGVTTAHSYWDIPRLEHGRSQRQESPRDLAASSSPRQDQWRYDDRIQERFIAPTEFQTGGSAFRPSAAEVNVHQTAQVGPRPAGRYIESELTSFWRLNWQDRVSTIQQRETRRGQYRVTKVTAKMLFAVNFGTRQLDHFLPPAADAGGGRAVQHDPATWASADTSPVESIRTMEDLRATLYCLQGAAVEWYPRAVASVFNAVHTDSLAGLYDDAPESLVHAVINLYSHVFTVLFDSINDGRHGSLLERDARSIMAHDSPDYIRMVRHVIERALIRTWVHSGSSAATGSHLNTRRQRRERTTTSPVPPHILRLIPTHNGKAICLRSQTQTGCSFRSCKHPHEKVQLPEEVTSYVTSKYGALATDYPNLQH